MLWGSRHGGRARYAIGDGLGGGARPASSVGRDVLNLTEVRESDGLGRANRAIGTLGEFEVGRVHDRLGAWVRACTCVGVGVFDATDVRVVHQGAAVGAHAGEVQRVGCSAELERAFDRGRHVYCRVRFKRVDGI